MFSISISWLNAIRSIVSSSLWPCTIPDYYISGLASCCVLTNSPHPWLHSEPHWHQQEQTTNSDTIACVHVCVRARDCAWLCVCVSLLTGYWYGATDATQYWQQQHGQIRHLQGKSSQSRRQTEKIKRCGVPSVRLSVVPVAHCRGDALFFGGEAMAVAPCAYCLLSPLLLLTCPATLQRDLTNNLRK